MSILAFDRPPAATWRRAAAVLLATLLAHAWVFDRVDRMLAGTDAEPPAPPVVNARLLEPPALPPPPVVAEPSPPPVVAAPKPRPRAARPPPPSSPPPMPPPAEPAVPVEAPPPAIEPTAAAAEPEVADATPAEPGGSVNAERPLEAPAEAEIAVFDASGPVLEYALTSLPELRAAMPGAARYVYRTRNSEIRLATGTTVVEWSIGSDDRYDLRLSTTALGVTVLDLHSQGTLRSFGLAPERYTETRARRGASSAAFDWPGRRVTFTARPHERPLVEGLQDRVSFQIQLMLLGRTQPQLFRKGAELVMLMAGRDDVAVYHFRSAGRDSTDTGIGRLDAVRIERVPASEYEARIEVWLAPDLGWLPARLRFTDRLGRVTESVLDAAPAS